MEIFIKILREKDLVIMKNSEILQELNEIMKNIKLLDKKISKLEEGTVEGQEKKKRLQRLERRKKQVNNELDKVINLIQKRKWIFSDAKRDKSKPGFVWVCNDKDGILIRGTVSEETTLIQFEFDDEIINIDKQDEGKLLIEKFENILLSYAMVREIDEWRVRKKEIKKSNENYSKIQYLNPKSSYVSETVYKSCIYCNGRSGLGNVCDTCRKVYMQKRKNSGGYPAYDPNAKGSNGISY